MKLILLFLITFNVYANYIPESVVGTDSPHTVWMKKSKCEKTSLETCIKIDKNYSCHYSVVVEKQVLEEQNTTCVGECTEELNALECSEGFTPKKGLLSVYCENVVPRHIGIDQSKKTAYALLMNSRLVLKNAFDQQIKDMTFGKNLYAKIMLMNKTKKLKRADRKLIRKNTKDIRDDLFDGDICSAYLGIRALVADETLITSQDLDTVTGLITAYKQCGE